MAHKSKRLALGQHFLKDDKVISSIVNTTFELAEKYHCQNLLEIGPGRGALTYPLIDRAQDRKLTLSERDEIFALHWTDKVKPLKEGLLLFGDFLEQAPESWLPPTGQKLMVVSNLPYSAGTAILVKLAEFNKEIPAMVLMFQAEVGRRLRAKIGTKEWGSLSIWIQNHWDVSLLIPVPPQSFKPAPKVDSEVVILTARAEPRIKTDSTPKRKAQWTTLLRTAFNQRRKMLRSGLPSTGPWRNALVASGVDGTKRAEALSWEEWQKLYSCLEE